MTQNINTPENRDKVAKAFIEVLTRWFATKKKKLTPELIQNANDHFDANMAMDEAFTKCGLQALPDDGQMTEDACDLWNVAWNRAVVLQKEAA